MSRLFVPIVIAATAIALVGNMTPRESEAAAAAVGGAVQFCTSTLRLGGITGTASSFGNYTYTVSLRNSSPQYTIEFTPTFKTGDGVFANPALSQATQIPPSGTKDIVIGTGTDPNINTGTVAVAYDRLSTAVPSLSFTNCRFR